MDDDDIGKHSTARVSNPFAALASQTKSTVLSSEEAIHQYKTEVMRKKGYPFSCLGLPDEPPVITGDISPEELRWYLSQGDQSTMRLIGERSGLLGNVDFTEFLRGATTQGLPIQRVGPYKVPDSQLPSFIPRSTFRIVGEVPDPTLSSEDLEIYRTRDLSKRIPRVPPPLELR
jgi:hypothetical protein